MTRREKRTREVRDDRISKSKRWVDIMRFWKRYPSLTEYLDDAGEVCMGECSLLRSSFETSQGEFLILYSYNGSFWMISR